MSIHTHIRRHAIVPVACTALALAWGLSTGHAHEAARPQADLLQSVRSGGHVIYIRHATTETDYADQVSATTGNCATQRTLSEAGWREAALIGAAFDVLDIPVGAVYSSEYCRAWQTAEIAFGRNIRIAALNFEPAEDYSEEQIAAMRDRVSPLLSAEPSAGTNTIIVGHDDPFEAATGVYPEPMGVAYVIKPGGNTDFSILGSIAPDDWPALLSMMR